MFLGLQCKIVVFLRSGARHVYCQDFGGRGLTLEVQDQTALAAAFKGLGDLSFDADRRRRFLTWLRDEGFQRWPASAADPAARALAQYVAALMDAEG